MTRSHRSAPPNILIVLTDQQHTNTISAAGCPHVQTPSLDRLVCGGTRISQSYCTHPVCSPSRSSLFTGRMPTETGVWINGVRGGHIIPSIPNMGQWFSQNSDYEVVYAGKWHVPECHTYRIPGFRVISSGLDHRGDVSDTLVSRASEAFLRNRSSSRPFLLVVSLLQPHDICQWLQINTNDQTELRYPQIRAELPELPENWDFDPSEPESHMLLRERTQQSAAGQWGELQWRFYMWNYYRLVEMVDAEIGRILQALDDTNQTDDTLIVFTSDHGEGLAHHRMVRKDFLYDEAVRVPLVFSWPTHIDGGAVDDSHLVSGLDLMPTVCDFAGIEPPAGVKGISLRPLLEHRHVDEWREFVVADVSSRALTTGNPAHTGRMVRSQRYKYVKYYCDTIEQLFDIESDPGETVNLAQEPAYRGVVESHREMLRQWERSLEPAPHTREVSQLWRSV
jgi:arylsulfatase A-like enzyme